MRCVLFDIKGLANKYFGVLSCALTSYFIDSYFYIPSYEQSYGLPLHGDIKFISVVCSYIACISIQILYSFL